MTNEQILIFLPDDDFSRQLENTLQSAGYEVVYMQEITAITALARVQVPDLIILGNVVVDQKTGQPCDGLELADSLLKVNPSLAILIIADQPSDELAIQSFRLGVLDFLSAPVRPTDVLQAVRRAIHRRQQVEAWTRLEVKLNTKSLQQRLDSLEALQRIGRAITSSLDLDTVLTAVVEAAVKLTEAEEGSLLLVDESSGELYIRAARNFREEFVRTFRVPVSDSLAGEVVRTGKPVLLDEKTPQKIKTAYLVHALLYVPLMIKDHIIGVLGVDNRQSGHSFSDYHLTLVSALAGYAAIAIQNANLYSRSELERKKYETILTGVQDAVVVMDAERRLILINQAARQAFGIEDKSQNSRLLEQTIHNSDLLELLSIARADQPYRGEINLDDGRIMNAQVTPIPEIGLVVTMQDITHLKELDRIKSDFVNTVSHDLRSPLTAILGYIELIERSGPTNELQKDFIHRVEASVQAITALINDLLDLGRIEAGFDARKEVVPFGTIIQFTLDGLRNHITDKKLSLEVSLPDTPSNVLGNPVRLRQMVTNLIGNAIKYTQVGGKVRLLLQCEAGQLIFQVRDNGPGIPAADQPYIFDRFYRASNVLHDIPGTGLGLAIVKSIVENHHGRIWVESIPSAGTSFTVVLPTLDQEL